MLARAVCCVLILSLLHAALPEDVEPVATTEGIGSDAVVELRASSEFIENAGTGPNEAFISRPMDENDESLALDGDNTILPESNYHEEAQEDGSAVVASTENKTSEDLAGMAENEIIEVDDESQEADSMEESGPPCSLFLSGIPYDCRAREIYNMFRLFPGFRYSTLHRNGKILVAFVTFETPDQAINAGRQVNGTRFDPYVRLSLRVHVAHRTSTIPRDKAAKGFIDFTGIVTYNPDKFLSSSDRQSLAGNGAGRRLPSENVQDGQNWRRMDRTFNDRRQLNPRNREMRDPHQLHHENAGRDGLPQGLSPDLILKQLEDEGQLDPSRRNGNQDATSVLLEHLQKLRGVQKKPDRDHQGGETTEVSDTLFLHHIDRTITQGELLRVFERFRGFKELRMRSPPASRLRTAFAEFDNEHAAHFAFRV
ncbi:hypothetical protein GUITHDRAFT_100384 [Guillardia theta CCMP2712]|uniref:RRM domain-containing protein n=1 Tax=Guillardia theta (strain CCMP2712) TaxID=905079 RepID=L1JZV2_GUITC|nr:hypothetical protein GUITHDRAFT_100384 [Guillardia theta CCMP2712]EKX54136.1 hypothetical protein GUITHDRAFT_100384 [Guillardia theta CCMP2712]|eukprot:XP_005841116.1 hypothetical protein GUITHDRAFT_100384 [Guillardia theta CCMP2712]